MSDPFLENLAQQLFAAPYGFDFFQTVRLLNRLDPSRVPIGLWGPPESESVRFRAHVSLSFPTPTLGMSIRRMPAGSSARSPGVVSPQTSTRLPPTTARLCPWPRR